MARTPRAALASPTACAVLLACSPPPPPPPPPAANACIPPRARCAASSDRCDDLASDAAHCGACGVACAAGVPCVQGRCVDGARDVAVGSRHVCAVAMSGGVRCWGEGAAGQLGDDERRASYVPRPVAGLDDAVSISADGDATCVVRRSGAIACWGTSRAWPAPLAPPRAVAGLPPATRVVLGGSHACAVTAAGELWCWGDRLGFGDRGRPFEPRPVPGAGDVRAAALGWNEDCFARASGEVSCWATGAGTFALRAVEGVDGAVDVGLDDKRGCAVDAGGRLSCWSVERGAGAPKAVAPPAVGPPVADGKRLAMRWGHACLVRGSGRVACWGQDLSGQLGRGGRYASSSGELPIEDVKHPGRAVRVAVGGQTTCAVYDDGALACWGGVASGQLGQLGAAMDAEPRVVAGVSGAVAMAADHAETCALTRGHAVLCWGGGANEAMVDPPRALALPPVKSLAGAESFICSVMVDGTTPCAQIAPPLSGVASLALRDAYTINYALLANGRVRAFGMSDVPYPALPVDGLAHVKAISAGHLACASREDGSVVCWEDAEISRAFDERKASARPKLIAVRALAGATFLGEGCAVTAAGRVACYKPELENGQVVVADADTPATRFGKDADGHLAALLPDGRIVRQRDGGFEALRGIEGAVDLAVGGHHGCALLADGRVACWGEEQPGARRWIRAPLDIPWNERRAEP
jgi:alpha-tubulin suppressor-like RCC1 family protein